MDATRVLDLLILARAFVEAGWTQNGVARNQQGGPVSPYDPAAIRFCLLGAMERSRFELGLVNLALFLEPESCVVRVAFNLFNAAVDAFGWQSYGSGNDAPETTHEQVLAIFDAACARVGKS